MPLKQTYPAEIQGPVDGSRVVRFVLNTGCEDRHGTRFLPSGCRSASFLKNPVFTWNHAELAERCDPDDVIGRALTVEFEAGETPDQDRIVIAVEFEGPKNRKADRCLDKVRSGFLRAVSLTGEPLQTHEEAGVPIADSWELWAASLCVVGSNPEALALRRYLLSGSEESFSMDPKAVCEALGLQEGASYPDILAALVGRLATSASEQDKALVQAALAMKPQGEPTTEAARGADTDEGADEGEGEQDPAMRAVAGELRAAQQRISELEKRSTPKPQTPEQFVEAMVGKGRWSATGRAQLLEIAKRSIKEAKRTVRHIPEGTFPGHRERLSDAAARATPNFGPDGPRAGATPASNGDGKRILAGVSQDIARTTKVPAAQ